jgi:hypothetical protein
MLNFHLAEDGSSVVRYSNFAIRRDEDFVQSYGGMLESSDGILD